MYFFIGLYVCAVVCTFDPLLELNAQNAKLVNIEIEKQFDQIVMTNKLFAKGRMIPGGLSLKVEYNETILFVISLYSPLGESSFDPFFTMESDEGDHIAHYLVNSVSGQRYLPGSNVFGKDVIVEPCTLEIQMDLVILASNGLVSMGKGYWG